MSNFLFNYHAIEPTTWVYLSSLLLIGLFFKFSRVFSVRNLDLFLLILLGPGLLMVYYGQSQSSLLNAQIQDAVSGGESAEGAATNPGDSVGGTGLGSEPLPDDGKVPVAGSDPTGGATNEGEAAASPGDLASGEQPAPEEEASAPTLADPNGDGPTAESPPADSEPGERPAAGQEGLPEAEDNTATGDNLETPDNEGANQETADVSATTGAEPNDELASPEAAAADPEPSEAESSENPLLAELAYWQRIEVWGFGVLLIAHGLMLLRLLLDSIMVRRPLLEPNLSRGGLFFIGISLFIFLMANVIVETPAMTTSPTDYRIARVAPAPTHGPGYELLSALPTSYSKACCVTSHLFVVVGMVLIGYRHFRNVTMGVGAAALYLMLPYTSLLTGRIEHVLPAAILTWAILLYRQPLVSGALLGLASGLVYYPFFLLPLWLSFYWHRGFRRFLGTYLGTLSLLMLLLLLLSSNGLQQDLVRMFGFHKPAMSQLGGIWMPNFGADANYRIPILVAFVALAVSMALWPAQKNLGTLLSCSAAILVASQFWHGYGGGTYMAWYLPMALLTIFRPNLEDRVAVSMLTDRTAKTS